MAVLELSFEGKESSLSVRHFIIRQAMSSIFEVDVVARSPNAEIDFDTLIGKPAGFLMMGNALQAPRVWSGICSHMEQIQPELTGLSTYFVRIVAPLWLMTHRKSNRIFEHMTIPAIVGKILQEYSIKPKMKLIEEHGEHEFRVQFGETDFTFISRLMEEEGISYLFEQIDEGGGYTSELILTDKPESASPRTPGIHFVSNPSEAARKEFVTNVRIGHRVRPGTVTFREYDFVRPDFELKGESAPLKTQEDFFEQYSYLPNALIKDRQGKPRVATEDEAKLVADIAIQAIRRNKRDVHFESNVFDLLPGVVFTIERHPRSDLAQQLMVTSCTLEGAPETEWTLKGAAAFAAARYRPLQETQKPMMQGVQSAIVVGESGEEIHTDEFGRVRVQFHWDRDGEYNEKSSCWMRVSQGWAGGAWGMITLPRVGQEVVVDFIEGDPDQPIIVGRGHNKLAPVPFKLPSRQATSTWKTNSSPKSEGFNEVMFDDSAGAELFYMQAQRNLSKLVKVIETERTGANRTIVVGANRSAIVGAVESIAIGEKYMLATMAPNNLNIMDLRDPDVTVKTTMAEMVDKKITLTTGKATSVLDGKNISLAADQRVTVKSGGQVIIQGKKHVHINGKPASGQAPDVEAQVIDGAKRPVGRTLGAVKTVFGAAKSPAVRLAMRRLVVGYRPPMPRERALAASPGTSPEQMIARRKVALDFYKRNGLKYDAGKMRPYKLPDEIREIYSHLTGIDFKQPVHVGPPPPVPAKLTQWHVPERKGQYYSPPNTSPAALGLGLRGIDPKTGNIVDKTNDTYSIPPDLPYIQTIASDKTDTWSVVQKDGQGKVTYQEKQKSTGGGKQYYIGDTSKIVNLTGSP